MQALVPNRAFTSRLVPGREARSAGQPLSLGLSVLAPQFQAQISGSHIQRLGYRVQFRPVWDGLVLLEQPSDGV
ncbi:hypothetical protein N658DRAFT_143814 [Parathielavia hyrcaniae]|uniref:Uncharacterized protein n=1 Tax=Parathielavia hyrcaniae TaxID=113614 RepID=A0AAN6PXY5_9PEZI|nr:hypothetical protein N658DRAFT_143814 [Parathielavia hyrcaniae]